MWHFRTWFSYGLGSSRLTAGLHNLKGLSNYDFIWRKKPRRHEVRQILWCHQCTYFSFHLNPDKSLGLLDFANMGWRRIRYVRSRWVWCYPFWRVSLNFTPSVICLFLFLLAKDLCALDLYLLPGLVLTQSWYYFPVLWLSVQICSSMMCLCEKITLEKKNAKFTWLSVNRFFVVCKEPPWCTGHNYGWGGKVNGKAMVKLQVFILFIYLKKPVIFANSLLFEL